MTDICATGAFAHAQSQPQPAVVLVHPQMGENIGMVARAMWNCGLTDLRLVAPRDGWPNPSAVAPSAGAVQVIESAKTYATTADAIADLHRVYATTARPRGMNQPVLTPAQWAETMPALHRQNHRVGVLFGGERAGLSNDDVALCNAVIEVPLNPAYKALNLAQAVLVLAYEWFQATAPLNGEADSPANKSSDDPMATASEVDFLLQTLNSHLHQGGFFRTPQMEPTVTRNIRTLFNRAHLSKQDVNTLHGIIKCLLRHGGR